MVSFLRNLTKKVFEMPQKVCMKEKSPEKVKLEVLALLPKFFGAVEFT